MVTILEGGKSVHTYRQLARIQNSRHAEDFHVESTLFDMLKGLKDEARRLTREANRKKPTAVEIERIFGGEMRSKDSTMRQATSTASRLPDSVIEEIGKVMNREHPDMCLSLSSIDKTGNRNAAEMKEVVD